MAHSLPVYVLCMSRLTLSDSLSPLPLCQIPRDTQLLDCRTVSHRQDSARVEVASHKLQVVIVNGQLCQSTSLHDRNQTMPSSQHLSYDQRTHLQIKAVVHGRKLISFQFHGPRKVINVLLQDSGPNALSPVHIVSHLNCQYGGGFACCCCCMLHISPRNDWTV